MPLSASTQAGSAAAQVPTTAAQVPTTSVSDVKEAVRLETEAAAGLLLLDCAKHASARAACSPARSASDGSGERSRRRAPRTSRAAKRVSRQRKRGRDDAAPPPRGNDRAATGNEPRAAWPGSPIECVRWAVDKVVRPVASILEARGVSPAAIGEARLWPAIREKGVLEGADKCGVTETHLHAALRHVLMSAPGAPSLDASSPRDSAAEVRAATTSGTYFSANIELSAYKQPATSL